jgi:hypothetical protein
MRPAGKARRPRISGNIRWRSNAAGWDAASAECRRDFHHGLQVRFAQVAGEGRTCELENVVPSTR